MTIKSLSSSQIAEIMKKGKAYNSGFFLLKVGENRENDGLIKNGDVDVVGDVVGGVVNIGQNNLVGSFLSSKKVFIKAVDRNRTKRRLREAFIKAVKDINNDNLKVSIPCFVILSKKSTIKDGFTDIVKDIKQILLKDYIIR